MKDDWRLLAKRDFLVSGSEVNNAGGRRKVAATSETFKDNMRGQMEEREFQMSLTSLTIYCRLRLVEAPAVEQCWRRYSGRATPTEVQFNSSFRFQAAPKEAQSCFASAILLDVVAVT